MAYYRQLLFHLWQAPVSRGGNPVPGELGQKLSELLVDDETEYYNHRDFERMKREHFYPWLNAPAALRGAGSGTVISPLLGYGAVSARGSPRHGYNSMGRFNIENMIKQTEKMAFRLAERFIWDNEKRRSYRNTALNYLWEQCCLSFTAKLRGQRAIR